MTTPPRRLCFSLNLSSLDRGAKKNKNDGIKFYIIKMTYQMCC